jgi:hypothetical protein
MSDSVWCIVLFFCPTPTSTICHEGYRSYIARAGRVVLPDVAPFSGVIKRQEHRATVMNPKRGFTIAKSYQTLQPRTQSWNTPFRFY